VNKEVNIMTTINLSTFVVRDSAGAFDLNATMDKFEDSLLAFQSELETEQATIGAAVHAVFDSHKGKPLTMPTVTNYTLNNLNVQSENFTVLFEKVKNYIRQNAGERGSSVFSIAKGKGGGVSRWVDVPVKK
jgi:hypothetical protein